MEENDKTLVDNSNDDAKTNLGNSESSDKNKPILDDNDDVEIDKKTGKKKIIDKRTAMIIGSAILLEGTIYAVEEVDPDAVFIDTSDNEDDETILTDENQDDEEEKPAEGNNTEEELTEEIPIEENNKTEGHIFNVDTAPRVSEGTVNDDMSFEEAFVAARAELGPGGLFAWHGQIYATFYGSEVDENHNPIIDYPTIDDDENNNPIIDLTIDENENNEIDIEIDEPEDVEEYDDVDIDEPLNDDNLDNDFDDFDC